MSTPERVERYDVREERRSRKQLSCAECHRLKLKCDRQVPCSNCVRRECIELCPNSVRVKKTTQRNDDMGEMRERLAAIEGMLASIPGIRRRRSASSSSSGSGSRERGKERDRRRRDVRERERERRGRGRDEQRDERRRDASRYRDEGRSRSPSPQYRRGYETSPHTRTSERWSPRRPEDDEPRAGPSFSNPTVASSHATPSQPNLQPSINPPHQTPSQASQATPSFQYTYEPNPPAQDESYGTLVIDRSGRSKWLGPTAGTEWLRNSEVGPRRSRSDSPPPAERADEDWFGADSLFPFPPWGPAPTMATILLHLPPVDEARVLLDAYYGNYTWNHDVAPRAGVQPIFERAYGLTEDPSRVHPQQLALLFIILAMGALHNPALPPHDPGAEHHLAAARWCLVKGDFIGHNTIAGLQALVIMAHYALETEKGRNGDSAWPLWGLAMRLVTAMGLHIDGRRWNLPPEVAEERRHVFWECHTIDVFQANCFSRPSSLRPEHIDTAFPGSGERDFRTLKFELCRISGAVLDQAMDVRPTAYSAVDALYDRLCAFERHIPFRMRCRTALLALPSAYADAESATRDSPPVSNELALTFQQFTLALNVSEAILFLQRPYFVRALQEAPQDPTRSAYAKSYLAVVERCNVLIEVVGGLYELYPTVTARHWFFWYHLFTAAVCLGTMIILNPTNPLAGLVLGQLDHSLKLYSSVLRDHATPSLVQNHQWLLRLRARALSKVEHAPPPPGDEADVDVELLGWRTRLVERARGRATATTIQREGESPISIGPSPVQPLEPLVAAAPTIDQVLQQHFVDSEPQRDQDPTTDFLLHQFWDPTTLLESREGAGGASNWWSTWDLGLPGLEHPM
ncbi:hypothetical protein CspeluHIS016_0601110 [Cutaneotrichosporon spelunceum]|uniref:Zn(2)-C6 fungal-type domain-containing protein n=1 Tax=Cutaneotrichosporon spelunceum TaxID=1672016 RepID=A0AAD3TY61_9TREE|nr:hypothetical protein CspeluHIS016_0601110 [Cutaneotrichosporon spelunceum]